MAILDIPAVYSKSCSRTCMQLSALAARARRPACAALPYAGLTAEFPFTITFRFQIPDPAIEGAPARCSAMCNALTPTMYHVVHGCI